VPLLTLVFGVAFILLGVGAYLGTGTQSVTALIPAFFGVVFVVLGVIMRHTSRRKHAGHAAAVLAVLGLLGSARGVPDAIALAQGGEVERPQAAIAQTVMVVLCLAFVVLAIKSFVDARRGRDAS
jgi:uncharacterized membrane protein YoaK (UPF0700 family)